MSSDSHNVVGIYGRHAHAWARLRGQNLLEKVWLNKFLALLPETPSVLDIGCGFGQPIGQYLQDSGCAVTGVDTSPELIQIARERIPKATWIISDMRDLHLKTKFDGILAWDSTFLLTPDDQCKMFPLFQQHAARGAALMFTSGPDHGVAVGEIEGERLYHSSLAGDEYRALLHRHGFEVVEHVTEDPDCGRHTVWLARLGDAA